MKPSSGNFSLGAIVIGALLCLAAQLLLALLGSSVGLLTLAIDRGDTPEKTLTWGAGVFTVLGLAISFFLGGFVASQLSRQRFKMGALWHGLGVWSVVIVGFVIVAGNAAASLGALFPRTGAGLGVIQGARSSADDIVRQLEKIRIVTDMEVLEGKAVTQIQLPNSGQQAAGTMDQKGDSSKEPEKVAAATSWGAFGAVFLAALASALGGLSARRRVEREEGTV